MGFRTVRSLVLFPLRNGVALFIFLSQLPLWLRGTHGVMFSSRAPIFWGDNDRAIFCLKRLGRKRYGVVRYDLEERKDAVVFSSATVIHTVALRNDAELIAGSYVDGDTLCTAIDLKGQAFVETAQYRLPGVRLEAQFMPNMVGFLAVDTVCSDDECFTEFRAVTAKGDYLLGPRHPGRILSGPILSNDESMMAYSDDKNIYLFNVSTGKQRAFPFGRSTICNWSDSKVVLASCREKNAFVTINGETGEVSLIQIATDGHVGKGNISPSGKFVVYWLGNEALGDAQPVQVYSFLVSEQRHALLGQWAMVLGMRWSRSERSLSLVGIRRRDLFDVSYGYKMSNAYAHDKEIIRLNDSGCVVEVLPESAWTLPGN